MMDFIDHGVILYLMTVVSVIAVLGKVVSYGKINQTIQQAKKLPATDNVFLRELCNKYQNMRETTGVNDVSLFLQKELQDGSKGRAGLTRWSGAAMTGAFLNLLIGIAGALAIYLNGGTMRTLIINFAVGIISATILVFFDYMLNIERKVDVLEIELADYLNNRMGQPVIINEEKETKASEKTPKKVFQDDVFVKEAAAAKAQTPSNTNPPGEKNEGTTVSKKKKLTEKEEKLLEEIMKDYL